jgi:hypothetical protein
MIIDDGLAAIAATPEKFDVVVTTNMFGDIGSDIAAKVTGGVGLVSSNNTNPSNPQSVSMFETMGGTADDIAGQNKANPVALIDAAAEMLLHIGGKDNIIAAELIKTSILVVLAKGDYVGDIQKGSYQEARGKEKLGTQEFAEKIAGKIAELKRLKVQQPQKTIKQLALERTDEEVKVLFDRVLRSYEQFANDMQPASAKWVEYFKRNAPPNPIRARSRIVGFDMFVDDSGVRPAFTEDGSVDETTSVIDPATARIFEKDTGIAVKSLFDEGKAGSLQSLRSFGQYSARALRAYVDERPEKATVGFGRVLAGLDVGDDFAARFSDGLREESFQIALVALEDFDRASILLVQAFYLARAEELGPILSGHGFMLARATSRGTEIYPTMCDFEKRDVDRFRVEIDPAGKLAHEGYNHVRVQAGIAAAQAEITNRGWIIAETMLNRSFTDGEGSNKGKELSGVSVPYAKGLGSNYAT